MLVENKFSNNENIYLSCSSPISLFLFIFLYLCLKLTNSQICLLLSPSHLNPYLGLYYPSTHRSPHFSFQNPFNQYY